MIAQDIFRYFFIPIGLLLLHIGNSHARVQIVECEDQTGDRGFYKTCPPGMLEVSSKILPTKSHNTLKATHQRQATLYLVPECEACDRVREFLTVRGVQITEKDVDTDLTLQQELKALTGTLKVPVTVIDNQPFPGYDRAALDKALSPTDDAP